MPAPAVASMAKKAGVSQGEAEKRWSKAKARAKEQGHDGEYDYIMGIFKRMMGEAVEENKLMEATVTGMIPMMPHPLETLGPFSEEERQQVVNRIKSIFPRATEDAIELALFGGTRSPLAEQSE